jgi:hypothetical protein
MGLLTAEATARRSLEAGNPNEGPHVGIARRLPREASLVRQASEDLRVVRSVRVVAPRLINVEVLHVEVAQAAANSDGR